MKICNVAFCGMGKWVMTYHVPNFQKLSDRYRIVGFYDCFEEKAREAAAQTGAKWYSTMEELIADRSVDLVLVATKPVPTHFDVTMKLLEGGKNVVLEKPMTYDSGECDALIAKAKEKGVIFTVHHNMRYSTSMRAAEEVIRTGAVGSPVLIEIASPRSWYENIDFSNYAAHMVDQALALNHSPLKEVTANLLHPEAGMGGAGYGSAYLRFEEGPEIFLTLNPMPLQQSGKDPIPFHFSYFRFNINGTTNSVGILDSGPTPSADFLLKRKAYYYDKAEPDFGDPDFVKTLNDGYFEMFYKHWANAEKLEVTAAQARNVIRCLELMVESSLKKETVPASGMLPDTFQ